MFVSSTKTMATFGVQRCCLVGVFTAGLLTFVTTLETVASSVCAFSSATRPQIRINAVTP